jgi:hypothetical protein
VFPVPVVLQRYAISINFEGGERGGKEGAGGGGGLKIMNIFFS